MSILQTVYCHRNDVKITEENFIQIHNQKVKAIDSIHKLFEQLKIKYVISHGDLIQYVRKKPIYHDDDVDIRICINDVNKLYDYFESLPKIRDIYCFSESDIKKLKLSYDGKYDKQFDLYYDNRANFKDRFLYNGIQSKFLTIYKPFNFTFDLVPSIAGTDFWLDYHINWLKIKKVNCYDIYFYVPSDEDTHKVLSMQYGDYINPVRKHNINVKIKF